MKVKAKIITYYETATEYEITFDADKHGLDPEKAWIEMDCVITDERELGTNPDEKVDIISIECPGCKRTFGPEEECGCDFAISLEEKNEESSS